MKSTDISLDRQASSASVTQKDYNYNEIDGYFA